MKWDKQGQSVHQAPSPSHQLTSRDIDDRIKVEEWTIKIAQAMVIAGKISISALPRAAYNLANDIDLFLKSRDSITSSEEKK